MNKSKKIAITGAGGYIGSSLEKYLRDKGYDVCGIFRGSHSSNRPSSEKESYQADVYQADISDRHNVENVLRNIEPDIIIHAAALSGLAKCEKNKDLAMKINVEGTKHIVNFIQNEGRNIKLIFMSSDYVFVGEQGDYKEYDELNPQTFYGVTKAESESIIRNNLDNYVICRTANVYGGGGGNFFNFVVTNLKNNQKIDVFDNVFYTPTYIYYLLESLNKLIEMDFVGIIHLAGQEKVSRYDFALKIAGVLGKDTNLVRPIKQRFDGLIARDSSLNSDYARQLLGTFCPAMEKSLHYCLGNLIRPYFYYADGRGMLIGISRGLKWEEINYVESVEGSIRGNHYHEETIEGFYIIKGRVKVSLLDRTNNSRREFVVNTGDFFIINPNILHIFESLVDSEWLNLLSKQLNEDSKDIQVF